MLVSVVSVVPKRPAETESTGSVHKQTTDESTTGTPRQEVMGVRRRVAHAERCRCVGRRIKMARTDLDTRFTKAFHQTRGVPLSATRTGF